MLPTPALASALQLRQDVVVAMRQVCHQTLLTAIEQLNGSNWQTQLLSWKPPPFSLLSDRPP